MDLLKDLFILKRKIQAEGLSVILMELDITAAFDKISFDAIKNGLTPTVKLQKTWYGKLLAT